MAAVPPAPPLTQSYTPPPPGGSYAPPPSGTPYGGPPPATPIPNYLIQSILVTICCCLPLGVVAIIFAAQVNSKLAAGDVAGARDASNKAKMFCWIAFGIGIVVIAISMLMNLGALMQGFNDGYSNR